MIIKNLKIVKNNEIIDNGYIEIQDKLIVKIAEGNYEGSDINVVDGNNKIAMPGFIDLHTHGGYGVDFMEANEEQINYFAKKIYEEGVTTFLLTTLTSDMDSLKRVCNAVANSINSSPALYGIHLEGPYISLAYKGAQNEAYIRDCNICEINELQEASNGNVRYITLAPETNNSSEFIKYVTDRNVVVSVGHSAAQRNHVKNAIANGLTNVTHINNAMRKYGNEDADIIHEAIENKLYAECIFDGVHINKETLINLYNEIKEDRFVLITDSLQVKGTDVESFELFGLPCYKTNQAAYLTSGKLAGSVLTMNQAVKNAKEYLDIDLIALSKIASTNAAKSLKLNDRGVLEKGKLADIVLLNENLDVVDVFKNGIKVF